MERIVKALPFGADTLVVPFTFERDLSVRADRLRDRRAPDEGGRGSDDEGEVTDDRRL